MSIALGKHIRDIRINLNISQSELAARLEYLSQSQISKIEKGDRKTTAEDLIQIAKVLGVAVEDIVSGRQEVKQ